MVSPHPLGRESKCWFHASIAAGIHRLPVSPYAGEVMSSIRNDKLHIRGPYPLVTSYERQEFSTDWQIYRLINCSFVQTWKKTWNLYFRWRHCTLGQQCGNLKSSIKAQPTMQKAVIKQQSSALLIVCERIHLWAVDSSHTESPMQKALTVQCHDNHPVVCAHIP